jgi:hypothetical protein
VQQVGPVTYGGSTSSMTVSLKQPPKQGDTLVVNASPTSVSGVSITGGGDTFTQTSPGVWTASNIVGLTWTPSVTVKWSAAVNNPSVTITEETP